MPSSTLNQYLYERVTAPSKHLSINPFNPLIRCTQFFKVRKKILRILVIREILFKTPAISAIIPSMLLSDFSGFHQKT